eukprot:COSAG04_NODE_29299_length_270_cov_0.596491_1_plen_25_part_01
MKEGRIRLGGLCARGDGRLHVRRQL